MLISSGLDDLEAQNPLIPSRVTPHLTHDGTGFRVRHLAFDAGAVLPAHSAPLPVVITVVDGRVLFEVDGITHDLARGAVIIADAHVPHEVRALERSRLILTLVG